MYTAYCMVMIRLYMPEDAVLVYHALSSTYSCIVAITEGLKRVPSWLACMASAAEQPRPALAVARPQRVITSVCPR